MPQITRRFEWDAAHRVLKHESKCKHIHGHRYVAEVTVAAPELDALGRVIDFGEIKRIVGGWIDAEWDHNILLNSDDPLATLYGYLKNKTRPEPDEWEDFADRVFPKAPYIFECINPTAEVIAARLFHIAIDLLPRLIVTRVRVWETPNCYADYTRSDWLDAGRMSRLDAAN